MHTHANTCSFKVKNAMKIRVENNGGLKELLVFFKKD